MKPEYCFDGSGFVQPCQHHGEQHTHINWLLVLAGDGVGGSVEHRHKHKHIRTGNVLISSA
jgi:hypothetical protein